MTKILYTREQTIRELSEWRGFNPSSQKWHYGHLIWHPESDPLIAEPQPMDASEEFEIHYYPGSIASIGMYSGSKTNEKNPVRLYDGDLIKITTPSNEQYPWICRVSYCPHCKKWELDLVNIQLKNPVVIALAEKLNNMGAAMRELHATSRIEYYGIDFDPLTVTA